MRKRLLVTSLFIIVFGLIIFVLLVNHDKKVIGTGLINLNNLKNYEVDGLDGEIDYSQSLNISNIKIPNEAKPSYIGASQISVIMKSDNTSIIPNVYVNKNYLCAIDGLNLKKGDIIKIQFLSDSRNPIKVGTINKEIARIYAYDSIDNDIYEVSIPYEGGIKIALYNNGDISTCIINGKIIIE